MKSIDTKDLNQLQNALELAAITLQRAAATFNQEGAYTDSDSLIKVKKIVDLAIAVSKRISDRIIEVILIENGVIRG